jgi:hypothetical protein
MHPETPTMNLRGMRNMTAILAFCANQPTHQGGAHRL